MESFDSFSTRGAHCMKRPIFHIAPLLSPAPMVLLSATEVTENSVLTFLADLNWFISLSRGFH